MVPHSRAADGANRLRPINQPKPIKVQEDKSGNPIAVIFKGQRLAIDGIKDRWRIDDEWWRKEISRLYYQVILQNGRVMTLFHDLLDGGWFTQSALAPKSEQDNLTVFRGQAARIDHSSTTDVRGVALP